MEDFTEASFSHRDIEANEQISAEIDLAGSFSFSKKLTEENSHSRLDAFLFDDDCAIVGEENLAPGMSRQNLERYKENFESLGRVNPESYAKSVKPAIRCLEALAALDEKGLQDALTLACQTPGVDPMIIIKHLTEFLESPDEQGRRFNGSIKFDYDANYAIKGASARYQKENCIIAIDYKNGDQKQVTVKITRK